VHILLVAEAEFSSAKKKSPSQPHEVRVKGMKPEQVYQELKDLADKLGVGSKSIIFALPASGKKRIVHRPRKPLVIIDKHKSLSKKIRVLAAALSRLPHEASIRFRRFVNSLPAC